MSVVPEMTSVIADAEKRTSWLKITLCLQMVVYDKPYFSGKSRTITGTMRDFMTRTDRQQTAFMYSVGSLKVLGGMWVLLCNDCIHWTLKRHLILVIINKLPAHFGQNYCRNIRRGCLLTLCLSPSLQLGWLREGGLPRAPVPAGGGRVPGLEGVGRLRLWAALC